MFDKLNLKLCTKTYLQMILRDIKKKMIEAWKYI